ncbi:MAG: DUF1800 domain-containing protein [Saprospiraceae bacterium]|nr:DUF1800 domain-containing protein [Saprospiraceae bacterium]
MASITLLNQTLGFRNAKHLLRRTAFRYRKQDIDSFASLTVSDAVDLLFVPIVDPIPEPQDPEDSNHPFWINAYIPVTTIPNNGRKRECVKAAWFYNAISVTSIRHKLVLFLYNNFTVAANLGGKATEFYDYLRLLDFYAYDSVKDLALKVTYNCSMLKYLDNNSNSQNAPNENYARELLELFTIGKGPQIGAGNYTNYTEADIVEAAKVLTGLSNDNDRAHIDPVTGIPQGYVSNFNRHDSSDKTFSSAFQGTTITGATVEADLEQEIMDLLNMIFSQVATAENICRKLYRFFVHSNISTEIETDIIQPMTQTLMANNYRLEPVVKQLLKSQHFYDADDNEATDEILGGMIKSPLQLLTDIISVFDMNVPDPVTNALDYYKNFSRLFVLRAYLEAAGMDLFDPPSVAGYAAYYQAPNYSKYWFDSSTIISRYKLLESLIAGRNKITDSNTQIMASLDLVEFFQNSSIFTNRNDPDTIVSDIVQYLFPESIDADRFSYFLNDIFLDGAMAYNWTDAWQDYLNSPTQDDSVIRPRLEALFSFLVNSPEFQTY